jgi:hypothetical protein
LESLIILESFELRGEKRLLVESDRSKTMAAAVLGNIRQKRGVLLR